MTEQTKQETFDAWCLVELFGHAKLAGKVSEANIAGGVLLRVDVPEIEVESNGKVEKVAAYTKFYGTNAIYSLTVTTQETCEAFLRHHRPKPVMAYELAGRPMLTANLEDDDDGMDEDF